MGPKSTRPNRPYLYVINIFASVNHELLSSVFNPPNTLVATNSLHNLGLNALLDDCDTYKYDLEVNDFFALIRSVDIPKSDYVYVNNIHLLNRNILTNLIISIRSIPKNLHYFADTIFS